MAIVHTGSLHLTCLSTDSKPTDVPNGYIALETDTGSLWSLLNGVWTKTSDPNAVGDFSSNLTTKNAEQHGESQIAVGSTNLLLEGILEELVNLRQDMGELIASMNGKQYNDNDTRWEER